MENQKFSKKELERLGCSAEEIDLVMKYQKKLPILSECDEFIGFCINVRSLYRQIINSDDMSNFSRWIKRALKNYRFAENIDFTTISPIGRGVNVVNGGDIKSLDYYCTIDMAKQLAMVDKKETGFIARKYFLLMESLIKKNKDWWKIRNPQKENYKPLCEALSNFTYKMSGRSADDALYAREANFLNIIATGLPAQSIKLYLGVGMSELTRDSLESDYNNKIDFLQKQDIICLGMNMGTVDRVKFLISAFDITYPDALPLKSYQTRDDLIKARDELLNTLSK